MPDGSRIAVYDFGGSGPPMLLVHATGFHAHVHRLLAEALAGRWRCIALDLRAHGRSVAAPTWEGSWSALAGDLLAVVDGLGLGGAHAFGHSCGGASLLLAEEARPGTFAHLYLLEPVVMPFEDPPPAQFDHPLVLGALRRREVFASKAEAESNYASKPPLATVTPAVLHDYVEHGFETLEDGSVRLRCRGSDEARVYAYAVSHTAYRDLARVRCPVTLAYGEMSGDFGADILVQLAGRLARASIESLPGLTHFAPLEDPGAVAASVIRAADTPPT